MSRQAVVSANEVLAMPSAVRMDSERRMHTTAHPLVYEINTRVLLRELARKMGGQATLATIPDEMLDEWAQLGFDAIWMMGVWTTGKIGLEIARNDESLLQSYKAVLPDFTDDDVVGSPYAVKAYAIPEYLGGARELLGLRRRLRERGLSLILDFVPNHTARDHQWVSRHPEYYINGQEGDEVQQAGLYFRVRTGKKYSVLAYGRDPNYPGWTDTAQLNIRNPETRKAMLATLKKIATMCDGARCDMAMLLLDDVFEKTWGERSLLPGSEPAVGEFWAEAIRTVREEFPEFMFIAEAYWDREWQLQQLGFDYTYDKRLYERLSREGAGAVYDHLKAEADYQRKSVRFIENHDEQRAAQTFGTEPWHFAAATVMSTVPGMVLFHDGQFTGSKVKLPVQLGRRPSEEESLALATFYGKLLPIVANPAFRSGSWTLLHARPAWHENYSWMSFLAFWWRGAGMGTRFVVVNYAPNVGQCYIELPLETFEGTSIEFRDLIGTATFSRERAKLLTKGMYFDLPPYGFHVFEVLTARLSS